MPRWCGILLLWASGLQAQVHPLLFANDTLPDGRKEPLNPFLGRVAVYNEWFGASGSNVTFNFEFQLVRKEIWGLDVGFGIGRLPLSTGGRQHEFHFPLRIQAQIGRRRSRFTLGAGLTPEINFSWFEKNWPPPNECYGYCPEKPRFAPFFQMGYRFQSERGFMVGLNAQFFFNQQFGSMYYQDEFTIYPWGGLYFGYRLPSAEQHRLWTDRAFKRRVRREMGIEMDDDPAKKKRKPQPPPIAPTEAELQSMGEENELKRLKRERLGKLDKRLNGRSLIYAEGFGATGYFSVNFDYSLPLHKAEVFMLTGRFGVGGPTPQTQAVTMPLALGLRAMKNYRGGGLSAGVVPVFGPDGQGIYGFIQPEVQFHTVYGVVFGVHYQLILDPSNIFLRPDRYFNYGGFMLGYRLLKMKPGRKTTGSAAQFLNEK